MHRSRVLMACAVASIGAFVSGVVATVHGQQPVARPATVFENARLIVGDGCAPIERGALGSHDAGGQRVIGWGSHMEMEAFVNWIGMTPSEAIAAATSVSAKFIGVNDRLGTLAVGKGADFIVLDANPLDDIRNTRRMSQVYLRGKPVDRPAMKARWQAACAAVRSTR